MSAVLAGYSCSRTRANERALTYLEKRAKVEGKRSWFDKRSRHFAGFLVKRHTSEDFYVSQYFFPPIFASVQMVCALGVMSFQD